MHTEKTTNHTRFTLSTHIRHTHTRQWQTCVHLHAGERAISDSVTIYRTAARARAYVIWYTFHDLFYAWWYFMQRGMQRFEAMLTRD